MGTRTEIPELLSNLGLVGTVVELGVYRGEFSQVLLEGMSELGTLHLVDVWRRLPGFPGQDTAEQHRANFAEMLRRLEEWLWRGKAKVQVGWTVEVAALFAPRSVDAVYVDAGHSYSEVLADLHAWWPKVKDGGVMCGDDYAVTDDPWHQVVPAVDEFFAKKKAEVLVWEDETWWVQKGWRMS